MKTQKEIFHIKMARISTKMVDIEVEAECQELAEAQAHEMAGSIDFALAEDCGVEYEIYTIDGQFPEPK